MPRLLLVTHRSPGQDGGPSARWRSLLRYLPAEGWEVDVVSAPLRASAVEFAARPDDLRRAALRARVMAWVARCSDPVFALVGMRPDALPLSMTWIPRGVRDVRARLAEVRYDAVLATGPPMVALIVARLATRGGAPPLVVELRDLWAGSPAFDRRGGLLGAIERWVFAGARAIVACTPEAAEDLRARHPAAAARVQEVPNGFEPELLARRVVPAPHRESEPLTILHSGTLTADRPLTPLLRALARPELRERFRLVLHGHLAPAAKEALAAADPGIAIEVLPPSSWEDAVQRIAAADATLVTQGRGAGDATAVASKVYEYLALGRPVLCLTDGGATEALLRRLGAEKLCARLSDPDGIAAALTRLADGPPPAPVPADALAPYDRRQIATRMAELLGGVAGRDPAQR